MDLLAVILIDDGNDGDDESRERKLPSAALLLRKGYDSQSTSHRDQEDGQHEKVDTQPSLLVAIAVIKPGVTSREGSSSLSTRWWQ